MSVPARLEALIGSWRGEGRLFRPWMSPAETSYATTAQVRITARGFLNLEYTWSEGGNEHDGLLLLSQATADAPVEAVWVDSWHQSGGYLLSTGGLERDAVSVRGSYPAPPGPDWGWRTVVAPAGDGFELVMYNISPEGEETLAVRNRYQRV